MYVELQTNRLKCSQVGTYKKGGLLYSYYSHADLGLHSTAHKLWSGAGCWRASCLIPAATSEWLRSHKRSTSYMSGRCLVNPQQCTNIIRFLNIYKLFLKTPGENWVTATGRLLLKAALSWKHRNE